MASKTKAALSGRLLDAAVERRVFGRCPHEVHAYARDNRDRWSDYTTFRCRNQACRKTFGGLGMRNGHYLCPHYSTKIAEAEKLILNLETRGYYCKIVAGYTPGSGVWASFDHQGWSDTRMLYSAHGATIAEAVSRASLVVAESWDDAKEVHG